MATYTITTPVNIDTLATKVGSDTYNINGGYLTVDQDTRYGKNQNTSAAMGNLTLSATLGGTVEFNSTLVRIIPYNTGTGVVPAYDTTITRGSASGKLIGVYATLASAPTAVAASMPASGFIKIRQWNSVAYSTGALTGISATATAADRAGWLEIVGVDALTMTCNRLGTFKVRGDWFDLGTTDGTRATTYQIPSNGALVYLPGVWVETAVASNLYEFYPCAGSTTALLANIATDEVRGRWCWISTAGLLRFGHDGTNSTGGFIPGSGRKIRIPSIFFMCCTAAGPTVNVLPNATLATRMEFATTGGGVLDIQNACFNWYLNLNQPYSVALTNVATFSNLTLTECATAIAWSHVGVGQEAQTTNFGLLMSLNFAGGTMSNCTFTRALMASSGNYTTSQTDIFGFVCTNERMHMIGGARGNATTGSKNLVRGSSCSWTNTTLTGGGRIFLTTCTDVTYTNTVYADHQATTTNTTIPMYIFDMGVNCLRVVMDGLTFGGLTLVQPYSGILNIVAAGCTKIKLRNIGTYASPLSLGATRQDLVAWTRTTTTATVTKVAHGLKVNDIVYVPVSSDIAAIVVGAKTVATVVSADVFTFACLSAGGASGTISYYPTMSANVFVLAAGAAANDVAIQRVYTPHTRTNLYTADNSSKSIRLESVFSEYVNAFLAPQLNGRHRGVTGTPLLTAQTSVYGTTWLDGYVADVSQNTNAQSWTRSSTTVTVTANDHRLRTGLFIVVTTSSSTTPLPLGQYTVTVLTSNTFTIVGVNSGATSGTLSFDPLVGRVAIQMNEASPDVVAYTIDAGVAAFTSTGSLFMPNVGDQVTFNPPVTYSTREAIRGHARFPIAEALMAGGTINNYDITYSLDKNDGSGYGTFHNLHYTRAGAGGSSASTTVTMTSTTGVEPGDYVRGTGIAPNAKVVTVDSGTNVTVDIANTATVSGTLRFFHLPSETGIDASIGFFIKVRVKTTTANAAAIKSLLFYTFADATARAAQYQMDSVAITVAPIAAGSEVRAYLAGTNTEVDGTETSTGSSHTLLVPPNTSLDIRVHNYSPVAYQPADFYAQTFANDQNFNPVQRLDLNFYNP